MLVGHVVLFAGSLERSYRFGLARQGGPFEELPVALADGAADSFDMIQMSSWDRRLLPGQHRPQVALP